MHPNNICRLKVGSQLFTSVGPKIIEDLSGTLNSKFKNTIINPLIENGFFELTNPDKPKSPTQKYRLTNKFIRPRIKS